MNIIKEFNEKSICEKCLKLNDEKFVKVLMQIVFGNQTTQVSIVLALKYLLHIECIPPFILEEYGLRRYSIALIYLFLKNKNLLDRLELNDPFLDRLIENGLSTQDISNQNVDYSSNNLLVKLYINNQADGESYLSNVKKIKNMLKPLIDKKENVDGKQVKILTEAEATAIVNILSKDLYFFHENRTSFIDIFKKDMRQFDMLIAEGLLDKKFINFKIEIPENQIEDYKANFTATDKKACFMNPYPIIFGYMVHYLIEDDNLKFEKPVRIIDSNVLKLCELNRNLKTYVTGHPSVMNFLDRDNIINKGLIQPFEFIYNDERYRFSKNGLEKI